MRIIAKSLGKYQYKMEEKQIFSRPPGEWRIFPLSGGDGLAKPARLWHNKGIYTPIRVWRQQVGREVPARPVFAPILHPAEVLPCCAYSSPGPVDFMIVGLGNPGKQYENTRHNAGFLAVDTIAQKHHTDIKRIKFKGLVGECSLGGKKALLLKPSTFMNLSG